MPIHVAIIMDGNGRWAQKRGLPRTAGHRAGVKAVKRIVRLAGDIGLKYLTLFTFSTENWNRPKSEVSALMKLLGDTTRRELAELLENNVRLIATGNIDKLPDLRREILLDAIERTTANTGLVLNLALNYSGRNEIIQAVKAISIDIAAGKIQPNQIDDALFATYLQTCDLPEPDLLIRTSGEMRISNFFLWQTAYTELYVTDILWPDFSENDFLEAILDFQGRERRFGKISPVT
ncbi:MAG TPA: isoprenyl transferase [candidate division Zixibacteria bacterium]|nr:isoprenyl transferase [candidate division Zixibacteria bacterium]HBY99968.1 isoprenyl transferase [candidate division Zixibacteria bacterium]